MTWNDIDDDAWKIFSERELMPVRLSFVTLVHPTQAVEIFSNISTAFGTLAIR